MKRILTFMTLFAIAFLLVTRIEKPKRIRAYVTRIDIYAQHPGYVKHYRLTDDRQMGVVLSHLRSMNHRPDAEESPVPDKHNNYTVWVHLANGRCHLYEQLGTRYFRKDATNWKTLDPDFGKNLIIYEGRFHTPFHFSKITPKNFDKTTKDIPPAFV